MNENNKESLAVVITAYNEAGNITVVVKNCISLFKEIDIDYDILIVDDGSNDGTGKISDELSKEYTNVRVLHLPFNSGFGAAQKAGIKHAKELDYLVVIPADNQFNVYDLKKFLEIMPEYDFVLSYRENRVDPFFRMIISKIYNFFIKYLLNIKDRIYDINWVKMYKTKLIKEIPIKSHGWAIDTELICRLLQRKYKYTQISIHHYRRTWGNSLSANFTTFAETIIELMRNYKEIKIKN